MAPHAQLIRKLCAQGAIGTINLGENNCVRYRVILAPPNHGEVEEGNV